MYAGLYIIGGLELNETERLQSAHSRRLIWAENTPIYAQ